MKNNIKKIFSILVTVSILLSFSQTVMAAARIPVYQVDGAFLFFEKSTGEITGFAGEPRSLTIPSMIAGYRVVSIGDRAFRGCVTLRSVTIPETVVYVGSGAFSGCSSLTQVNFNGTVENIPLDAFEDTPWLVNTSDEFVIAGKTLLLRYNGSADEVSVPAGVRKIAPDAFAYNTAVKKIILPEGLVEIGDNAFIHCYSLSEIVFPQSLSYVGIGAFDDTMWLRSRTGEFVDVNGILVAYNGDGGYVNVPEGITALGSGAFMSNDRIVAVYLPESMTAVSEAAFGESASLRTVVIPAGVQWIDEYAFSGSDKVVLYGAPGSYAEYYAALNGLPFYTPVTVMVNGTAVYFDVAPVIIGENTYAPMRAVLEAMGLEVIWQDGGIVTVRSDNITVSATEGSTEVTVNGEKRDIPAPPVVFGGRVMLPVRAFAEIFGANVRWDNGTRTVMIET